MRESNEPRKDSNMKRLALVLMVSTLLLVGGPAVAELCTIDAVPAATLLLPYFEVDTNPAVNDGVNTIFSINNASAAPALAHVTLWTDWSWPTIDFDIFLTGYDIHVVNLRDLFIDGSVTSQNANGTITADEQSDSLDTISPHGSHPIWDGSFQDCGNFLPFYSNPLVTGDNFDRLVQGHTGDNVDPIGGGCAGADYGDGIARGYITIDSASRCSTEFANEAGYFGGLDPVANNNNQLWGEYFLLDQANDFAKGDTLVHIEAEDGFVGGANNYTFYSRYTAGGGNADNREPLGATWGARYLNNPLFTGGTSFLVWRDSTSSEISNIGYTCGGPGSFAGPSWFPLNEVEVIAFDESENATELCRSGPGGVISPPTPGSDPACFPLETQNISSTDLGFQGIESPWAAGWMFLNLAVGADAPIGDFDPTYAEGAQSYVAVNHSASGRFSVGLQAIELTSACSDSALTLTDVCDPTTDPPSPCVIN